MKNIFTTAALLILPTICVASEYQKDNVYIEMIEKQSTRPAGGQYQNHTYIKVSTTPSWGGGSCNENWIALPDNDKELFSIALSALASGNQVIVRVDDSLEKFGGTHCQVTTLAIKMH